MRKILGAVLVGLGVFALAAAVVATFWAPGVVKKTPLDVNSVTTLSGEGARLNAAGDALDPAQPVSAVSVTRSDTDVSTDETIVFVSNTCLNVDEGQEPGCYDPQTEDFVLSNSPLDVIAVDRKSAMAVDSDVEQVTSHEGLINKWPFDAEQKTYPYWDSVTQSAVDASYDRTEVLDGLETYVYQVQISDAPTMVSGLSTENDGTYDDLKEIYVDPRTGSIVNQTEQQQRYFDNGTQVLDLSLAFTDDQVAGNVTDAKDSIASLDLLLRTVPLVGFILGLLLVLGGLALLLLGDRGRTHSGGVRQERTPVGV